MTLPDFWGSMNPKGGGSIKDIRCKHSFQLVRLKTLLIYAKANQENLTSGQKIRLKKCVNEIINEFG